MRRRTWLRCVAVFVVASCVLALALAPSLARAVEERTPEFEHLSDLVGKRFGAVSGSIYSIMVPQNIDGVSENDFQYYENTADGIAALKAGKIDVWVEGKAVSELAVARNTGITTMSEAIDTDDIGICLKKNSPLTEQFNERIAAYWKDGTIDTLHDKWMAADEDAKTMPEQDWDAPNGKLTVSFAILEPMAYLTGADEVKGYEAELVLDIARDLGYTVEFSSGLFTGVLAAVQSGKVDVAIGNISISPERAEKMDLTDPDYKGAVVPVVRDTGDDAEESGGIWGYLSSSFKKTFIVEGRWRLILSGLGVTVLISVCSGFLGTLLGFGTVLVRRSGVRWAVKLVDAYQALIGGVPLVVVLMVLDYVVFGSISIAGEIVAIVAFTIAFGATAGTTMWTAITGIDVVEEESGLALGYTRSQVFKKIIFPQAAMQFTPQLVGQFVSLVKDTAVVGYIAVQDLTRASDIIRSRTMDAFFPLLTTAVIYFLFCRLLAWALGKLTANLNVENRPRTIKGVTLEA